MTTNIDCTEQPSAGIARCARNVGLSLAALIVFTAVVGNISDHWSMVTALLATGWTATISALAWAFWLNVGAAVAALAISATLTCATNAEAWQSAKLAVCSWKRGEDAAIATRREAAAIVRMIRRWRTAMAFSLLILAILVLIACPAPLSGTDVTTVRCLSVLGAYLGCIGLAIALLANSIGLFDCSE